MTSMSIDWALISETQFREYADNFTSPEDFRDALNAKDQNGLTVPALIINSGQSAQGVESPHIAQYLQVIADKLGPSLFATVLMDIVGDIPIEFLIPVNNLNKGSWSIIATKLETRRFNQFVTLQENGDTALSYVTTNWEAVIENLDSHQLYNAIALPNNKGNSPLHWISDAAILNSIADKLGTDKFKQALMIKNHEGEVPAHYMSKRARLLGVITDKLNGQDLYDVLTLEDNNGDAPMHEVAKGTSLDLFQKIADKLGVDNLEKALMMPNKRNKTPMHALIEKEKTPLLRKLVQITGKDTFVSWVNKLRDDIYKWRHDLVDSIADALEKLVPLEKPVKRVETALTTLGIGSAGFPTIKKQRVTSLNNHTGEMTHSPLVRPHHQPNHIGLNL